MPDMKDPLVTAASVSRLVLSEYIFGAKVLSVYIFGATKGVSGVDSGLVLLLPNTSLTAPYGASSGAKSRGPPDTVDK